MQSRKINFILSNFWTIETRREKGGLLRSPWKGRSLEWLFPSIGGQFFWTIWTSSWVWHANFERLYLYTTRLLISIFPFFLLCSAQKREDTCWDRLCSSCNSKYSKHFYRKRVKNCCKLTQLEPCVLPLSVPSQTRGWIHPVMPLTTRFTRW